MFNLVIDKYQYLQTEKRTETDVSRWNSRDVAFLRVFPCFLIVFNRHEFHLSVYLASLIIF